MEEEPFEFTMSFLLSESFDDFFLGFIAIVVNFAALFIESCTFLERKAVFLINQVFSYQNTVYKFLEVKRHSFDSILRI